MSALRKIPLTVRIAVATAPSGQRARSDHMERMRRQALRARQAKARASFAELLRETRETHPRCRCRISVNASSEDLLALGGGCTMPGWCCPRLDAVRRGRG